MTLRKKLDRQEKKRCDIRSECSSDALRTLIAELAATGDEVVVFRRDNSTGKYDVFTACCEAVLPPLNA